MGKKGRGPTKKFPDSIFVTVDSNETGDEWLLAWKGEDSIVNGEVVAVYKLHWVGQMKVTRTLIGGE